MEFGEPFDEVEVVKRVLDFDTENRPISYLGNDYVTADLTAIAWSWGDVPHDCEVHVVTSDPRSQRDMLLQFCEAYAEADVVTGHFIRGHDLPIINGALVEHGLPTLPPRLASDTKLDLIKTQRVSMSQESLAAMLGVPAAKFHMTQTFWRAANRLEPAGIDLTRKRVVDDVIQHVLMRREMVKRGLLLSPRIWPSHGEAPVYVP